MGSFGPSVSSGYHKGHEKTEPKIMFFLVCIGQLERCTELFSDDFTEIEFVFGIYLLQGYLAPKP